MIKFDHLHYLYEQKNKQLHFHIAAGETVAILGKSGAGKSTLLNLIAGFIFPLQGKIFLDQVDASYLPPRKRPVSILFQENNLFAHLTISENIGLGLHPGLKLNTEQKDAVKKIMEKMELTDLKNRLPSQLSGGQRQRAALARCLIRQQPILLLDEPFSALNESLRVDMFKQVKDTYQQRKMTLLIVTHHPQEILDDVQRVIVLENGIIIYDGDRQNIPAIK